MRAEEPSRSVFLWREARALLTKRQGAGSTVPLIRLCHPSTRFARSGQAPSPPAEKRWGRRALEVRVLPSMRAGDLDAVFWRHVRRNQAGLHGKSSRFFNMESTSP